MTTISAAPPPQKSAGAPAGDHRTGDHRTGDHGVRFASEVIPYISRLYPAALRLTRSHCDAEDLIQETFAKAYVKFHQFTPGTNLKAWLYTILVRTFYSSCRHKDRRVGEVLAAEIYDTTDVRDALKEPPRSAEAEALDNLGSSGVMRALDELPESFRRAIYLADIEGYRYSEIAEMMGTPLGTVMSRVHRGRAMLREKLQAYAPRTADRGHAAPAGPAHRAARVAAPRPAGSAGRRAGDRARRSLAPDPHLSVAA